MLYYKPNAIVLLFLFQTNRILYTLKKICPKPHINIPFVRNSIMVLEAKCPKCDKRAEVDEEMIEVNCKHCGFRARYDEYVEIMKGRAVSITDDFQMNWDRHPI